jgi:hypothetical protein
LSFRTDDSAVAEGLHLVESAILNTLFSSTPGVVYSGGRKLTTSGLVLISGFIVYFSLPHILVVFLLTYLLNSGATFVAETLNFDVLHMRHAYTHTHTLFLGYYQPVSRVVSWFLIHRKVKRPSDQSPKLGINQLR